METQKRLTPEEAKLIELFRSMDEGQRHKVILACEAVKVAGEIQNRAFG